jgi:Flp pilus assembly protein TadD
MPFANEAELVAGQQAFAAGCFRKALADFETYTADSGGDPSGLLYLGLAHRELGDLEASARAIDSALALAPADPHLLLVRARIELERGGADAVDRFERARALLPSDARILLGEAAALYQAGQGDKAVALLQPVARAAAPGAHDKRAG